MSVIQITKFCSLKCDYCFDKENMNIYKNKKNIIMNKDVFKKGLARTIEYFKNKNILEKSVCITGGEPTLHPNFKEYINDSIRSGLHVHLLSNFTFGKDIQEFLKKKIKYISFLVNINDPKGTKFNGINDLLRNRILNNLEVLQNESVQLSLNIWNPFLSYNYFFDVLKKYPKINKRVRIGIVNPIVSQLKETVFEGATWLKYKMLGKKIDQIVKKIYDMGYEVFMDCGAGHCIFSKETIDLVYKNGEWNKCSLPIPEININTGYSTCFTLTNKFNEDNDININKYSITNYVNKMSIKTEFYKNYYLTLPKCQKCKKFNICPKFCTSNNIFFYDKIFGNINWENINFFEDVKIDINLINKKNSIAEYLLANGKYDILEKIFENMIKNNIKINGRQKLYYIFNKFLLKKINKEESIKIIKNLDTTYGFKKIIDKNFINFILITIQKY